MLKKLIPGRFRKDLTVVPVVRLEGALMQGSGGFGRQNLNLSAVAGPLKKAFSMKQAPVVAICINSPGGSPVQSRYIHDRIRQLADENDKKVVVFTEDVAASGGYWLACAGDEIIADGASIIGSIGVIAAGFGFTELLQKIGVERRVYTAGKNKLTLDPFQPENEADVDYLKSIQLDIHELFIDHVKARRGDKLVDDDTLFTGRFWTGTKAQELGLVDGLGDLRGTMVERYGKDVQLKLIGARRRSLLRGMFSSRAGDQFTSFLDAVEERFALSRYGL